MRLFGLQDDMGSDAARAACAACARHYARLEEGLYGAEYLAGAYSFADITFFMAQVFAERKGALLTPPTPRLMAWRERVGARPAVREVVGAMMRFLASQERPVPAPFQSMMAPTRAV